MLCLLSCYVFVWLWSFNASTIVVFGFNIGRRTSDWKGLISIGDCMHCVTAKLYYLCHHVC